jgi:hypothetical protein
LFLKEVGVFGANKERWEAVVSHAKFEAFYHPG